MEYKQMTGINQSTLKLILKSPTEYLKAVEKQETQEENEDKDYLKFGTLVDMLALSTEEDALKKFYISSIDINTDNKIYEVVKEVFNEGNILYGDFLELDILDSLILSVARRMNFQSNYKDDTLINKIKKEGADYFNMLKFSNGKTIISNNEFTTAKLLVNNFKTSEYTQLFFQKSVDVEIRNHVALQFSYLGLDCKAELDKILINHKLKTITEVDIKTDSGLLEEFSYKFFKYRYDFQRAFYRIALRNTLLQTEFSGYSLTEPFLLVGSKSDLRVAPYLVPKQYLNPKGFMINDRKYEGVDNAFERLKYLIATDNKTFPQEFYTHGYMSIKNGYETNTNY